MADDNLRRFVISFYPSDDSVSINEESVPNSGFPGGLFHKKDKIHKKQVDPNVRPVYYQADDVYVGVHIRASGKIFKLTDADPYVLTFMNDHPELYSEEHIQAHKDGMLTLHTKQEYTKEEEDKIVKKFKAKPGSQVIAPLPLNRIHESKPFEVTGIDFAGPLYVKDKDKVYIALSTCAVTRAIHLEIVSSLHTEQFLMAFRRFVSRRGICRTVNCDNAKTFKAAENELKTLYANVADPNVQNYFGKKGIKFTYIVERAAWWGGYWERMVKMTKIILRKILGRALLSFEELQTILTEIEAILNSRPITYVYNDASEPSPLTPSHFLIGERITSLPHHQAGRNNEQIFSSSKGFLLKRYLYREKLLNQFWKRWKGEYLLQLKGIHNVHPISENCEFNVNDVVLVGDDKVPRHLRKLAKITELFKGRDEKVRSVMLKTASGFIKRPIQLIYKLEL